MARRTRIATTISAASSLDRTEIDGHPTAVLLHGSFQSTEEERTLLQALKAAGYDDAIISTTRFDPLERNNDNNDDNANNNRVYVYELSRATGMLKLVSSPSPPQEGVSGGSDFASGSADSFEPPRWIPMVRGEENVLVANGWSFLDPDESEPSSAYDIDDANAEGEYRPKWGIDNDGNDGSDANKSNGIGVGTTALQLSSLGYDISPLNEEDVLSEADSLSSSSSSGENAHSRGVLLHGRTDPPKTKITCNGYDFRGSVGQSDIPEGIFFTAIGGLPLFSSIDLSPITGSSGWLTFSRPLAASHVLHIDPENDSMDRRIEVVCARSRCHLGHYFGPTEGYCINASALKFIPSIPADTTASNNVDFVGSTPNSSLPAVSKPISWRLLDVDVQQNQQLPPSHRLLKRVLESNVRFEKVALGCGCFWHVEDALRRLQGVVSTEASYAGGHTTSPTYQDVCEGTTGHAEVVSVVYDPDVCPSDVLFDCFLAMHDPTKVRAHGKHALYIGQYRSCIFVTGAETEQVARDCLEQCRRQLGKDLSTEVRPMGQQAAQQTDDTETGDFGQGWCWRAEDGHQRRDERIKGKSDAASPSVFSAIEWLNEYGRRTPSIIGSSLDSQLHPDDDGMAMMMI